MCLGRIICTLHYEKQTTIRQTCSARKCVWGEVQKINVFILKTKIRKYKIIPEMYILCL